MPPKSEMPQDDHENEDAKVCGKVETIFLVYGNESDAKSVAAVLGEKDDIKIYTDEEKALDEAEDVKPSVFVVQQLLGGKTGIEFCRRIRGMSEWGSSVPVLIEAEPHALSEEDRQKGEEAGVNHWITKPYSDEYILTVVGIAKTQAKIRWCKAELPPDEKERMEALRMTGILDSTDEAASFDRFPKLTAWSFQTPISVISMVDETRQWFKSCEGICVKETSRDSSFCAHAILTDDVFIVRDATMDDRFADSPLVVGGVVRFYAGIPIKITGADGEKHRIGTLCMIDQRPRELEEKDVEMFRELGKLLEEELDKYMAKKRVNAEPVEETVVAKTNATPANETKTINRSLSKKDKKFRKSSFKLFGSKQ